ncbi:MAG: 16S rRNA (adenine(1518)-N(6)/adenine(1519)-N(6))-dimethyltransferase RsmA [Bacteroidota bacterium]
MHNLKPRKYLGQHFLTDQNIAARIVRSLQVETDTPVFEIGPGEGVLTEFLAERYPQLSLLEVDERAVIALRERFAGRSVSVIETDVLKWDLRAQTDAQVAFIGNLPYNISSPIFFRLLEYRDQVKEGVFMIQKEVAERICSPPGSKAFGILSVLMGAYYDLSYEFSVPPQVFRPPPKVMSGVLRMSRKSDFPDVPFSQLKRVVKQAFSQRRKTLRNALKGLPLGEFEGKAELLSKRAEQLSVETFVEMTRHLEG